MNVVMLIGGSIATLGVLTICYGLWTAMMGVTRTGRLPAGSREIQVRGMAITVFGIGVMTLSAGLLVTDVLGRIGLRTRSCNVFLRRQVNWHTIDASDLLQLDRVDAPPSDAEGKYAYKRGLRRTTRIAAAT